MTADVAGGEVTGAPLSASVPAARPVNVSGPATVARYVQVNVAAPPPGTTASRGSGPSTRTAAPAPATASADGETATAAASPSLRTAIVTVNGASRAVMAG